MTAGGTQPVETAHAVCVVVGDRGVLITGPSGSGKTTLALSLIDRARRAGRFARLVADDRIVLTEHGGRLVGRVPASIAGLAEAHGFGPGRITAEAEAAIDLVVDLVTPEDALRFHDGETRILAGCELPLLTLASRNASGAILAVAARLELAPFDRGGV